MKEKSRGKMGENGDRHYYICLHYITALGRWKCKNSLWKIASLLPMPPCIVCN